MIAFNIELCVILIALVFLVFFSLIERAVIMSSTLALRLLLEKPEGKPSPLIAVILEDRNRILTPLYFGTQLAVIVVVVLSVHLCLKLPGHGLLIAFLVNILISILFRQLLPGLMTQNDPERKLAGLLRIFLPFNMVLCPIVAPIEGILNMFRRMNEEEHGGGDAEDEAATEEEIQAYLEIGEDEGILEEEDSKLIHSVVEFGNTLVKEVMTPRMKIIACEEKATIVELRDIMVTHRHSRIPIYREDLDRIVGIVYIRQLLAQYVKGREGEPITGIIRPVLSVPETKPVSKLLKELQDRGDYTAIVIDEFGGVSGLVTIEDLVEEIVGEIWDEDEVKVKKIIEENPRTFVLHGSAEVFDIEKLTGKTFDEWNCSTAAGLVIAYLGRIPVTGEVFDIEGLKVQILYADRKKVHRLRIQMPDDSADNQPASDGE